MADWYVSSTAYAAVSVFATTTAYTVGQFVRPSAPAANSQHVYRCTTAGTSAGSEPTWNRTDGATTTSGGAVFTNVSGGATYNWSAALGGIASLVGAAYKTAVAGDRVFVSSDHSESGLASSYAFGSAGFGVIKFISVNKAGSVPPVASDITNGAAVTGTSSNLIVDCMTDTFWQGFTFTQSANGNVYLSSSGSKANYFKNCAFVISNAGASLRLAGFSSTKITFDNTTLQVGATTHGVGGGNYQFEMNWINTPSAIAGATLPSSLFVAPSTSGSLVTCRGVDLSAVTGTLMTAGSTSSAGGMVLLDSCKIAPGVTRYAGTPAFATDVLELVNCYDGTNFLSERYTPAGTVTTEFSTTMVGGATDDVGLFTHKMVSSSRSDIAALPLESFWFEVENTVTGSAKTATVHLVSSAALNNTDIRLVLEYQGTASSSLASFADSLATQLTASASLGASGASWSNPPATPQYQQLSITFTPQVAGRVRGRVLLGKASTTVWVNPQVIVS